MGYRSVIGAVLSVDAYNYPNTKEEGITKYKEMIGLIKLSRFYELMNETEMDRECIGWKAGEFYFHVEDWKWYPDYEVVKAWDDLWEQMQDVEGVSGYFCRVGEEVNDIDEVEFGNEPDYDAFHPFTSMSCDVSQDVFGGGDIGKELERDMICTDNNAIQA